MRVLMAVSGNHGPVAPFVVEQADALRQLGCEVELFEIHGHGLMGYLSNLKALRVTIKSFSPDILHAHYGICGLLCTLQHMVPVVVTYHGSDINDRRILPLSRIAMHRAKHNIFVSKKLQEKAKYRRITKWFYIFFNHQISNNNSFVLPCGVDSSVFHPMNHEEACREVQLNPKGHYVLFAGAFNNVVKNPRLAKEICAMVPGVTLLELKGYSRPEVAALMNAVDCLLMTSHSEGSPQVIKEAMACGCPIVSVDVGDVRERLEGIDRCHVTANREPCFLAGLLRKEIVKGRSNYGSISLLPKDLDNKKAAEKLMRIYMN